MKRFCVLALFVCACACGLHAQVVDTTVCDIVKNPKSFDGKIVRIKGTVIAGLDQFIAKDPTGVCGYQVDGIWIDYPQGTKGKAGPAAIVRIQPAHNFAGTYTAPARTAITLEKNKDFKQFDSLMSQVHNKFGNMCLGCTKYTVTATLVGRLDGVASASLQRDKAGKIIGFGGFGNLNAYPARLVLQSVSDVAPKEIDYAKAEVVTKGGDSAPPPPPGQQDMYDPLVATGKSIERLKGTPAGDQVGKDVAAFGKPGEKNGVILSFGSTSEASAKDEALGAKDSPDGIQFNCTMNQSRLEGDAELRAIVHMGQHISDVRTPMPGNEDAPLYVLEYNAWTMTVAVAAYNGQKSLGIPGGYLAWDAAWPAADGNTKVDTAIKDFLANEAALSR